MNKYKMNANITIITEMYDKVMVDLNLNERVEFINELREYIHVNSPFANEPVDFVKWVPNTDVTANDYNPNKVAPPEMELLEVSIMNDGYTQPIVTWQNDDKGKKILFVNPNARWSSKQWPWEYFRELIKRLSEKRGVELVLIGAPGDRERMSGAFLGLGENVRNIAGRTSLMVLAAMFKKGDCLITNDSGPMHLAVAVGLPVVAIFGPTNPIRTGPFVGQNKRKNRI